MQFQGQPLPYLRLHLGLLAGTGGASHVHLLARTSSWSSNVCVGLLVGVLTCVGLHLCGAGYLQWVSSLVRLW